MPGDCSFYVTVQMFNIGKKIKKNKTVMLQTLRMLFSRKYLKYYVLEKCFCFKSIHSMEFSTKTLDTCTKSVKF